MLCKHLQDAVHEVTQMLEELPLQREQLSTEVIQVLEELSGDRFNELSLTMLGEKGLQILPYIIGQHNDLDFAL